MEELHMDKAKPGRNDKNDIFKINDDDDEALKLI